MMFLSHRGPRSAVPFLLASAFLSLLAPAPLGAAPAWNAAPTPAGTSGAASPGAPSAPSGPVRASLVLERAGIRGGEPFLAGLVLEIEEGWHVYGREVEGTGLPTRADWILPPGFVAEETLYPRTTRFESGAGAGWGLSGRILLVARIVPPAGLEPGSTLPIGVEASWLACADSCVPGKARLEARLPVAAPGAAPGPADAASAAELRQAYEGRRKAPENAPIGLGLALALLLAFAGGILLNLMPCVLPVISLKIAALVKNAAESVDAPGGARRVAAQGLVYGAGILVSFWAIAGLLLGLRAAGRSAGWGFQFQDPRVPAAGAALFFLVSLNFFGVFEIGSRLAALAGEAQHAASRRGLLSSFASGLFATAAATPCTAPFMGAALGWALAQPAASALAVFTALGLGMALPYVLATARPGFARRLPPPGRWMESLRQAMGFPLLAAALWMAWLVARLSGSGAAFGLLGALLAAGAGAWIWGRWGGLEAVARSRLVAAILALVLVLGGLAGAMAAAGAPARGAAPAASGTSGDSTGPWEPWSPARIAALEAGGRPVFVDFSADWCLSCKVNEAAVLARPEVLAAFRARGVALLKADWTARDDRIARELEAHGRAGVPLYLLYAGDGSPPRILPELLTKGIVLEALAALPDSGGSVR